jgi:hypothetical protein
LSREPILKKLLLLMTDELKREHADRWKKPRYEKFELSEKLTL